MHLTKTLRKSLWPKSSPGSASERNLHFLLPAEAARYKMDSRLRNNDQLNHSRDTGSVTVIRDHNDLGFGDLNLSAGLLKLCVPIGVNCTDMHIDKNR